MNRRVVAALAMSAALELVACDAIRRTESKATGCADCHGGGDNGTGAPPRDLGGRTATTAPGVGAHTAHVAPPPAGFGLACVACHPDPRSGSTVHRDGRVEIAFGTLATSQAPGAAPPRFDAAAATCSNVYCHGTFQGGNASNVPAWIRVDEGQAACGTCHGLPPSAPHPTADGLKSCHDCHGASVDANGDLIAASAGGTHVDGRLQVTGHDAAWMDPASAGFHAFAAGAGLQGCTRCHGADLAGGPVGVSCATCHDQGLPAGVASWKVNCVMCHGGTDSATGAPPRTTWGQGADPVRTGAHTVHLAGSDLAPPFDCGVCHVKPADALAPGHVDGATATVTFAGRATQGVTGPSQWDRATATCSNVYCHGATLGGGSRTAPVWTAAAGTQAACGTCHGLPPPAPHPSVSSDLTRCNPCHDQTVASDGHLIPPASGGRHLDGVVEAFSGHTAAWMDPASSGFHAVAAVRGLSACQLCHGDALDQLPAGDCARCHGVNLPAGVTSWSRNCVMCHGGTDNGSGAPPRATWGNQATTVAIGAHTAHVGLGDAATTTRSGLAPKLGCEACHVKPLDAFAGGHLDGSVAVTGYTGTDPLLLAAVQSPTWTPASASCATAYCHGATLQGGTHTVPVWTATTGTEATCGSCHGRPPATGPLWATTTPAHLVPKHIQAGCGRCHDAFTVSNVSPANHVNGRRDVAITHPAPSPDPTDPVPPTLEACTTSTTTVTSPVVGWDCAGCHRLRDYLYNRCCSDPGAPNPDWCATYP